MTPTMLKAVAGFFTALITIADARAADDGPAQFGVIDGAGMFGMRVNLLLVLAVIAVAGWLLSRGQKRLGGQADELKIVASRPLGSRERIMVVAVGEEQIVIGVTPQSINHLHTLAEPLSSRSSMSFEKGSFAERLQQLIAKRGER